MTTAKRLILVIGNVHSGTSLLTKGLETMGVSLGSALISSSPLKKNELWEDPDFHTLNLKIVSFFGLHLKGILSITHEEAALLCKEGFLEEASQLLIEKFSKNQPLGIKDPRFSILLPFWKKVFQQCNVHYSFVIALRNPWSIAASKKECPEKSFWVWVSYLLSSLEHSEGHQRLLVDYDELIQNPQCQMKRVSNVLGLTLEPGKLKSYCDDYVDPSERHFYTKTENVPYADFYQQYTMEMYNQLLAVAQEKITFEALKKPFQKWKKLFLEVYSLLVLAEKNNFTMEELRSKIQKSNESIHELHKNINQKSFSIARCCQEMHQHELKTATLTIEQATRNKELLKLKQDLEIQNCLIAA